MIFENDEEKIRKLSSYLNISHSVSAELLTLAGGDFNLVVECSIQTYGLTQCKAAIINRRFNSIERNNDD